MKHQHYLRSCVSDGALDMNGCLQWAQTGTVNFALAKTQGLPFKGWTCSPLDESMLNTPVFRRAVSEDPRECLKNKYLQASLNQKQGQKSLSSKSPK